MQRLSIAIVLVLAWVPLVQAAEADAVRKADADLNTAYKALFSRLDDGSQQRLRDAQRAWIAFRDKECAFRAQGNAGGSIRAVVSTDCIAELSTQRTQQLKAQLDCTEGDVSCVPQQRGSASAAAGADVPCSKSAGQKKAEEYAQQCIQVSPATHPPCNVANPCELMIDEIKRSCAMIDKDAPSFCASYSGAHR